MYLNGGTGSWRRQSLPVPRTGWSTKWLPRPSGHADYPSAASMSPSVPARARGGRFQGRRIRLVRLVDTVHIAEGGGQDVPAEPECLGGERVLRSGVKHFVDLTGDPPHATAELIERDHRRLGQPGPAVRPG